MKLYDYELKPLKGVNMQEFIKISENIHILTALHEQDRPILGYICGKDMSMAIDTGNSVNHAGLFLKKIEESGMHKPKLAVLTHFHWDHVFGAGKIGALTLAHENIIYHIEELMSKDVEADLENADDFMKSEFKDGVNVALKLPEITFSRRINIDLGGVNVIAEKIECDHSDDSIVIHIPEDEVVFLGDCLYCGYKEDENKMYFTCDGVKNMCEQLKDYDAKLYINSHSEVSSREDFFSYLDETLDLAEVSDESETVEEAVDKFRASGGEVRDITKSYLELFFNGKNVL